MRFKQYTDVHEFYGDTYNVLMHDEAQNMILLGNVINGLMTCLQCTAALAGS